MKKIKKLLAMIMAMTMMLGMAISVSAAENDTKVNVTVGDLQDEITLYKVQIVEADTSKPHGWVYTDDFTDLANDVSIESLISIANSQNNGDAQTGELTSSTELAGLLENLKTRVMIDNNKMEGNVFNATSAGLYVIFPEKEGWTFSPTLVYVPVGSSDPISVQVKGAPDQIKKELVDEKGQSVSAGDVIQYKVTVKYPYISANYNEPSFKITDTLTNATLYIDVTHQVEVKVDGTLLNADNYTTTGSMGSDTLTINFNSEGYNRANAGDDITITYWVKVSDTVSVESPLENKVTSDLKLTPDGESTKTEYKVVSTPVKVTIEKVDSENTDTSLMGSVFALYKGNAVDQTEDTLIAIMADAESTNGITLPSDYAGYSSLFKADGTADGTIVFDGLDAQADYYVREIIAPTGYSIDGIDHQLVFGGIAEGYPEVDKSDNDADGDGVETITTTYKFNDFKVNQYGNNVPNTKLSSLPSTGGIGTTIFTIGGCAIMIAAAALYFVNRRKSEEN